MSTSVEFTGLGAQARRLRTTIDANIARVLDHGKFIMGPEVAEFEAKLREFCGASHALGCANGTDALQIALMASGIGAGDTVFVPSFTYTATAEVILLLGATPLFVEVDPVSFNVDCDDLEARITGWRATATGKGAIIAVDLFGLPADWQRLNRIAEANGLVLIADAAQSFGASAADGRKVGTLAPITTISFFPAKPLGCYGDGGAIFTEDAELAATMRSIRVHGQGKAKYETVRIGVNSRLDTLQAAILLAKIEVFAEEIENRNKLADRYGELLRATCELPVKPQGVTSAWAQYTVKVQDRDGVQARLRERGVPTAVYYPLPMHLQPAYRQYGGGEGSLPISEALSGQVLSLPMNPYWSEADAQHVAEAMEASVGSLHPATAA